MFVVLVVYADAMGHNMIDVLFFTGKRITNERLPTWYVDITRVFLHKSRANLFDYHELI